MFFLKTGTATMTNYTIIVSLLLPMYVSSAQTPAQNLEQGVDIYNAVREYSKGLKSAKITDADMTNILSRRDKGIALLETVIQEGTAEQIKVARYFKTNLDYELGFAYGMKHDNAMAYQIFKSIAEPMIALKSSDFPMNYVFFGKKFVVKWENFAPTQAEFYTCMGEISFNLGKFDDALQTTRLGLIHANTADWYKYIGYNRKLDIYLKKRGVISEAEYLDDAVHMIRSYFALNAEHQQVVSENKYPTFERGLRILKGHVDNQHPHMARRFGETGRLLKNYGQTENAASMYRLAIQSGHNDPSFWIEGIELARKMEDKALGITALDRLCTTVSETNCGDLEEYSKLYDEFGKSNKAAELRKRTARCRENRKTEEMKAQKTQNDLNNPFNVYVGVYTIPLLYGEAKRDVGGHIDFRSSVSSHEFGFSMIKQNKDLFMPGTCPSWDGFSTHYALKRFTGRNAMTYAGVLFGYTDKNFQPIEAGIRLVEKQGSFKPHVFHATEKEYSLLLNWGAQWLWHVIGADLFMGIGGTYSDFKTSETEYKQSNIEIQNDYLNAKKRNPLSVTARIGFSIGLNFGRKR
jgi:tetratricopeptide (TPR) repeat protein